MRRKIYKGKINNTITIVFMFQDGNLLKDYYEFKYTNIIKNFKFLDIPEKSYGVYDDIKIGEIYIHKYIDDNNDQNMILIGIIGDYRNNGINNFKLKIVLRKMTDIVNTYYYNINIIDSAIIKKDIFKTYFLDRIEESIREVFILTKPLNFEEWVQI